MKDLSLHILDIVQNSIVSGATLIKIDICEDVAKDSFSFSVEDNGKGIPADIIDKVTDPYFTSRSTRKVGLGLPLLKQNAEMAGGNLNIDSDGNSGTKIIAQFKYGHIDRPPIGDIVGVITLLIRSNPDINWCYRHLKNGLEYVFDTAEVKKVLDGMKIEEPAVIKYLKEMIIENLKEIKVL